jgi:Ca-activated chloride channel homolog
MEKQLCVSHRLRLERIKGLLGIIAILFTIAAGIPSSAPQIPTISVKTEEVRIDMLATENGRPIRSLKSSDFEVRDNDVLQKIEYVSFEQLPINAILIFDMSSSVAGEKLKNLKAAGNELLTGLKSEDRAALITFSHQVRLGSPLTADINSVKKILSEANSNLFGDSSLIDASYAGLTLADSKNNRPLAIVFTDGLDTSSWLTDKAVLESAKRGEAVVYAVTTRRVMDKTFLSDLCRITGGSLLEVESDRDLVAAFLDILKEFRHRYLLTYSPTGVSRDGWHQLKIRVKNPNVKIVARSGYFSGPANSIKD